MRGDPDLQKEVADQITQAVLDIYDADGNGFNEEDIKDAEAKYLEELHESHKEVFTAIDVDEDGTATEEELNNAIQASLKEEIIRANVIPKVFSVLGYSKNKAITKADLDSFIPLVEDFQENFDDYDEDADGELSLSEATDPSSGLIGVILEGAQRRGINGEEFIANAIKNALKVGDAEDDGDDDTPEPKVDTETETDDETTTEPKVDPKTDKNGDNKTD